MNARSGKKSERHNSALALASSGNLPADLSLSRAVRYFLPEGSRVGQPIKFRNLHDALRSHSEASLASKTIIHHGQAGNAAVYTVLFHNENDEMALLYTIPVDREADLDRRILSLFAEFSDSPAVGVGYQSVEHIIPASLTERAPSTAKHEAVLNKIFAASDWYDAWTICHGAGFSDVNPSAQPNRWKRDGKVFALRRGKTDVYPAYAFGDDFRPLPAMKDVLCVFKEKKSDLKIAAWFASVNSWLRDKRPLDVIGSDPKAVISAAKVEVAPIDHG